MMARLRIELEFPADPAERYRCEVQFNQSDLRLELDDFTERFVTPMLASLLEQCAIEKIPDATS